MAYHILFTMVFILFALAPKAQPADTKVQVSGQFRSRGEYDDTDFNKATPAHRSTFLRLRLNAAFEPADNVSTFVQLQDSRIYGSEPNTFANVRNADLHQIHLQVEEFLHKSLTLKMGRMELAYAAERLVGVVDWHNVGRAFDGTLLRYKSRDTLLVDFFGTKIVQRANLENPDDTGFYFTGFYATHQPKQTSRVDLYVLGEWNRRQTTNGRDHLQRLTIGTYDRGVINSFDYEMEAAVQFGTRVNPKTGKRQDVAAHMLTGTIGYTIDNAHKPRIALGYDYLSGAKLGHEDHKAFDTPFASNHKLYGFMDYFVNIPVHTQDAGLQDLIVKLQISPHAKFTLKADVHQFRTATKIMAKDNYGKEIDVTGLYHYRESINFSLGVSMFLPSDLMEAKFEGNSDPAFWAYLMTMANF